MEQSNRALLSKLPSKGKDNAFRKQVLLQIVNIKINVIIIQMYEFKKASSASL